MDLVDIYVDLLHWGRRNLQMMRVECSCLEDTNEREIDLDGFVVVRQLVDLLMDHQAKDAHHGGATVVQLDTTLDELDTIVKDVPAKVDEPIAEVSRKLGLTGY